MSVKNNPLSVDIVVVGGGHAGLTQSLLLAQNGFQVACIDRDAPNKADIDARTTAISYGSHKLFKSIGVWNDLIPHACPINDIQILDGSSPVLLDFSANDMQPEINDHSVAFGWIIENHIIHQVLLNAIKTEKNIRHFTNTNVQNFERNKDIIKTGLDGNIEISAKLVIGADGRKSFTREWMNVGAKEWSYNQQAIACVITHTKPHQNIAIEHFKSEGPFALLPMLDDMHGNHRSSIVWTQHGNNAQTVLNYNQNTFLAALNAIVPDLYGDVTNATKRLNYPLGFVHAYDYIAERIALISDAAHGIHPIAGQGLNLGLRDVVSLGNCLKEAKKNNQDIGSLDILKKYQTSRRPDNTAMAMTTDLLNRIFSNNHLSIKLARKIGLKIISNIKPAKKFFMRQAMGSAGNLPKINQK